MKPHAKRTVLVLTMWAHATLLLAAVATLGRMQAAEAIQPPPNSPASVEWNAQAKRLTLRYHGTVVLDSTVSAEAGNAVAEAEVKLDATETTGEKVEQRLKFTLAKPQGGVKLVLRGTATGSDEAFPAETAGPAQKRFPLVRNSVGLSRNLRNNALYDRRWDWLLIGLDGGATRLQPIGIGQQGAPVAPRCGQTYLPCALRSHPLGARTVWRAPGPSVVKMVARQEGSLVRLRRAERCVGRQPVHFRRFSGAHRWRRSKLRPRRSTLR